MLGLSITKRQKIVISSILVTIGFLGTQFSYFLFFRLYASLALTALVLLLATWSLWEGLNKTKVIMLFILPVLFALGFSAFYFLFPIRWLTRIPSALFFGLLFYLLMLAQNVFNIAAIKTIPLYRAASTVSFLFTVLTAFLLYRVLFSLNWPFYWNGVAVVVITFLLSIQSLWSIEMEKISFQLLAYSLSLAVIVGECGVALSFWPISSTVLNMWSIFLSALVYILLGVVTDLLRDRVNRRVVAEYIAVGALVFLATLFTTSWTG